MKQFDSVAHTTRFNLYLVAVLVVTALPARAAACVPAPTGLVSWWRAERSYEDALGPNDGASLGGMLYPPPLPPATPVGYTTGKVGYAFDFTHSSKAYVHIPDAPSLRFTAGLSIEAWVQPFSQTAQYQTILAKFDLPTGRTRTNSSYYLGTSNGLPCFALCSSGSPTNRATWLFSAVPLVVDHWSFVVATYDGATARLYVDAQLVAQTNHAGGIFASTADLGLGAIGSYDASGGWPWYGYLDEITLYDRALSPQEIQALFDAGTAGKCIRAPVITGQPRSQAVPLGEDAIFAARTEGTRPFRYQWYSNTGTLIGQTGAALLLEKVQSNRAGLYWVTIANERGSVTSSNASLSLLPKPACIASPNDTVSWWPADGSALDVLGANNGTTLSNVYSPGKVDRAFRVNGLISGGPPIMTGNSLSLNFGINADFSIEGWIKYLPELASAALQTYSPNQMILDKTDSARPPYLRGMGYALSLTNGHLACYLGAFVNGRTNTAWFISNGPDLRDAMSHHVALSVNRRSGNGGCLYVDGAPVLFFDPTPLNGSLSSQMHLVLGDTSAAAFDWPFTGLLDEFAVYSRALGPEEILGIRQAGAAGKCKLPPVIVQSPTNQVVLVHDNATFSVTVQGAGRFQWRKDGQVLRGATQSALVLSNVSLTNAGLYSVLITNIFGAQLSGEARLIVNRRPYARCKQLILAADASCLADGSIDAGSSDPDNDPITLVQSPPGPYPVGTNIVRLTAVDPYGASHQCSALVIVLDLSPPQVVPPANVLCTNEWNRCGAVVNYALPTATDTCSPVTNVSCLPASRSFFPVGVTTVQCAATDAAGNTGSGSFTVTVRDTQPPSIVCPGDITVTNAHDAWSSVVTFAPRVSDNCPGLGEPICNPPSGSALGPGVHPVTCSVVDASGNSSQCTFSVTVLTGNVPPVPLIELSPLAQFPPDTNLYVIALNGWDIANVTFDGSHSYDVDDTNFNYFWYEESRLLSTNASMSTRLELGAHEIVLCLDDGFPLGTNSAGLVLNVISPAEAVGIVIGMVLEADLGSRNAQPLLASLAAATGSFERGNARAAVNQLSVFQKKVRAQIAPANPILAQQLLAAVQTILRSQ